jgi:iron complex transport system substrate-binding protein
MKENKFTIFALLAMTTIVIIAVAASGCTQQGSTANATPTPSPVQYKNVTDMAGRTVTLPAELKAVVPIYGPGYEKIVMLGAEDKIVMCADYHQTHAAWAHVIYKKLDTLPALKNPKGDTNVEDVLKVTPDAIFYFGNDKLVTRFTEVGIPVICSVGNNTSLLSLKDQMLLYGRALGPAEEKRAEEYCAYFGEKYANITSITSAIPESERPTVYVTSGIPLRTRGGNSVMRDTVEKAGGIYVAKDLQQGTVEINVEQLIKLNPDIIIIDHAPDLPDPSASATSNTSNSSVIRDQIMNDPRLKDLDAVKNGRVYLSPTGAFFWDAGQQGILQLEWMAKLFHPDEFQGLDMKQELKDFYSEFFYYNLTDDEADRILNHQLPAGAERWGY